MRKLAMWSVAKLKRAGSGDPSPMTALGVFTAIRACVYYKMGKSDLSGIRVAVEGLGHVGLDLVRRLSEAGASLVVTDINEEILQKIARQFEAEAVGARKTYLAQASTYLPLALWRGILNDQTIPLLNCQIIAGAANNQLAEPCHARLLEDRQILYAPDYLINAGGLISVSYEGPNYDLREVTTHIEGIYDTLLEIFEMAKERCTTTSEASDCLAGRDFARSKLVITLMNAYILRGLATAFY